MCRRGQTPAQRPLLSRQRLILDLSRSRNRQHLIRSQSLRLIQIRRSQILNPIRSRTQNQTTATMTSMAMTTMTMTMTMMTTMMTGSAARKSGGMTMTDKPDTCKTCHGERWVCENHTDQPWNKDGCECGAGEPCQQCNSTEYGQEPDMPPGFTEIGYVQ
jgi:hypothetical protein